MMAEYGTLRPSKSTGNSFSSHSPLIRSSMTDSFPVGTTISPAQPWLSKKFRKSTRLSLPG